MPDSASPRSCLGSTRGIRHLCLLLGLAVSLMAIAAGGAEVYKWTDAEGHIHFGDRPPVQSNAQSVRLRINTYEQPEIVRGAVTELLAPKAKVVLYSAHWCGICKHARTYFRAHGIPFEEYDVETSAKGREDFARLGGRGVPIILVGARRMNGFSPSGFDQLYAQTGG